MHKVYRKSVRAAQRNERTASRNKVPPGLTRVGIEELHPHLVLIVIEQVSHPVLPVDPPRLDI